MLTRDIYQKYKLMPQLIQHQLWVAAVARQVSLDWQDRQEADLAVRGALLHDMGNMAKFKGLSDPYWIKEQEIFWQKWGDNAHQATEAILRAEGKDQIVELLREEGSFYQLNKPVPVSEWRQYRQATLAVLYADLRVAINGIVSLDERIVDLQRRYPGKSRPELIWGKTLEEYLQQTSTLSLEKIDESLVGSGSDLLDWEWD